MFDDFRTRRGAMDNIGPINNGIRTRRGTLLNNMGDKDVDTRSCGSSEILESDCEHLSENMKGGN